MKFTSSSIKDKERIDPKHAFCKVADPVTLSDNKNPAFSWSDPPKGTESFVLTTVDIDVPSVADDVNVEGREISKDLPRVNFVHWMLVNIPKDKLEIAEGELSDGVVARGKEGPQVEKTQMLQGLNDYTAWFKGDEQMEGKYYGYDGPCPPWNDALEHRYIFTLYALDIPRLELADGFSHDELVAAMEGHVLATEKIEGRYTLNKNLL